MFSTSKDESLTRFLLPLHMYAAERGPTTGDQKADEEEYCGEVSLFMPACPRD